MSSSPATRASLLVRLRDGQDHEAWRQFVELYVPLIHDFARKRGLQDADAADFAQEVLLKVGAAVKGLEYDPRKGQFRGWLYTLTRNKICDYLARQQREVQGSGDTGMHALLDKQPCKEEEDAWDREHEQRVFQWAAEQVRGEFKEATWQAFWQTSVDGKSTDEVARALGLSVGAVYVAKCRVLGRLKQQIATLEEN